MEQEVANLMQVAAFGSNPGISGPAGAKPKSPTLQCFFGGTTNRSQGREPE